jgi:hypothetical protein
MALNTTRIKVCFLILFIAGFVTVLVTDNKAIKTIDASSGGPPAGRTSAPGESNCTGCHDGATPSGQFTISAPPFYVPGQTYQITVTHATTDMTRTRWGFELTALVNGTNVKAGDMVLTNATTTRLRNNAGPGSARQYVEQATGGTFTNQTLGASWSFNWTAPTTNSGAITLYASGIQADNSSDESGDAVFTTSVTTQPAALTRPFGDFDGDGKTDFAISRHNTNGANESSWYVLSSLNNTTTEQLFGMDTDIIVPGDFIGDTKTDIAVWRPSEGAWYISQGSRSTFTKVLWGLSTDVPVPADYDGDGKTDIAVWRPGTGTWYINQSSNSTLRAVVFGVSTDKPVPADYDGDAKADVAVYRPSTGTWYALQSLSSTVRAQQFGLSTDTPVPADFDGDLRADFAMYRSSTSTWYILQSTTSALRTQPYGTVGDVPVVGDYDGDGKADIAVFRAGDWYVLRSSNSTTIGGHFGQNGDTAIPAAFLR